MTVSPVQPASRGGARYVPPWWLPGSHLQTVWSAVLAPRPQPALERTRLTTPDRDFIDLDYGPPPQSAAAPLWVLFHGLEGSSRSHYARAMLAKAAACGWQGLVVNFRGCSGEPNLMPRAYHSGDSDEIDWVLRAIADKHHGRLLFASGVSLGGNALLKWLGERGESARLVTAAAALCPPQDLEAGAESLARGFNRVYSEYFLRSLRPKTLAKLEHWPGLVDAQRVRRARDFFDFDDAVTAPLHGFASCFDYWRRSSCRQFLGGIQVPTLLINALNDPFVPRHVLARDDQVSRDVVLDYPAEGGHVGFPHHRLPGRFQWAPGRVAQFFSDIAGLPPIDGQF